jgi:glycerophosphoryl diester phosphodiesterase
MARPRKARRVRLPRVMGHRGAAGVAPENTIASIRAAAAAGVSWVEFDVMLTGDDVPVLFHDDHLSRVTGRDQAMAESHYRDLGPLDAGSWFAPAFSGEAIPKLSDALEVVHACRLQANIEIKPTPGRDVVTAVAVVSTVSRDWPAGAPAPFISSFSRLSLAAVRALRPDWPLGLIAWSLPEEWRELLAALECTSIHLNDDALNRATVATLLEAGYQVAGYTINDGARARDLLSMGVDSLITDQPAAILEAVSVAALDPAG